MFFYNYQHTYLLSFPSLLGSDRIICRYLCCVFNTQEDWMSPCMFSMGNLDDRLFWSIIVFFIDSECPYSLSSTIKSNSSQNNMSKCKSNSNAWFNSTLLSNISKNQFHQSRGRMIANSKTKFTRSMTNLQTTLGSWKQVSFRVVLVSEQNIILAQLKLLSSSLGC